MADQTPTDGQPDERVVAGAFAAYRDESRGTFPAPPPAAVFAAARRRHHQRWVASGLAAAMVAGLVAGGAALAQTMTRPDHAPVATPPGVTTPAPTESPSRTPHPPGTDDGGSGKPGEPATPRIDLRNATIELPSWPSGTCPAGAYTFADGKAATPSGTYRILPDGAAPRYADLDGEGGAEALARIQCSGGEEWADGVVAVRVTGDRTATTMAYVITFAGGERITGVDTDGRTVSVRVKAEGLAQRHRYRWDGERFAPVGGPSGSPDPGSPTPDPDPSTPPAVTPSPSGAGQTPGV